MMRFKKAATIIGNGNLQSYQNINEFSATNFTDKIQNYVLI